MMIQQNTPEWEALRKGKIGASDIPTIMGENPYKTPYRLFLEKTGRSTVFETPAMREGKRLEPIIRSMYEELTGEAVFPQVILHPHYPDFMASLDGLSLCGTKLVEFKSANAKTHALAKNNKVPPIYYGQCQWQMFHTSLSEMDYVSFGKDCETLVIVKVKRDQEYIVRAVDKAGEFLNYMQSDTPPPHKEYESEITIDQQNLFSELANVIADRMEIEALEKRLKSQVIESANGKNIEAGGIRIEKIAGRSLVDYDSIPQLQGIDLDQYRKPGKETWRISLI